MNISLLVLFFGLFAVLYLIIGFVSSKQIKTKEDFFLAGRQIGFWPLTFTLVATQIGGGMLLGSSEYAYRFGYYGIVYTLGMTIGFLILGLGFAAKLRSFNVSTTAELFEVKYGSVFLKKAASLLSVLSLGGLLAAQAIGLKSLLWGMGLQSNIVLIAVWGFIIIYTMLGGLKAVVLTDIFQVILIISVFVGVFIYSLGIEPTNFFTLESFSTRQSFFPDINIFLFLPILINTSMFALIEQDLAQRFFAAKTKAIAVSAALMSSLLMITFAAVPVYFGMKARLDGISVMKGSSPLIPILEKMTSDIVLVFIVCALGAAIISTADSLMCAISSNLSQDFDFSFLKRGHLAVSRAITAITGIVAFLIASFFNDIIGMISGSYELLISCIFVSIFACFFKKNLYKLSSVISISVGLISFVLFNYLSVNLSTIYSVFFSGIGYFIGDMFVLRFNLDRQNS